MILNGRHIAIVTLGQSLAMGLQGSPSLSTAETYQNTVALAGIGVGYSGVPADYGNAGLATATYQPLIASQRETIDYAMARSLHVFSRQWIPKTIVINGGLNGAGYLATKRGTQVYTETLARLRRASELSESAGAALLVPAVNYVSGETDHILFDAQGGAAGYRSMLMELSSSINQDYSAITGQTEKIKIIFCQTNASPFYPIWTGNAAIASTPTTALIQAELADQYPDLFVMAGPRYHRQYSADTDVHFSAAGYREHGEKRSQIIKELLLDKQWRPLAPNNCTQISTTKIKVDFEVRRLPLVLDASVVTNPGNFGFEYIATQSNEATIKTVTIVDKSVILDFDKPPLGINRSIGYAYSNFAVDPALLPGAYGAVTPENVGPINGARGCLRDSDDYPSLFGYSHHNYCLQFIKRIE